MMGNEQSCTHIGYLDVLRCDNCMITYLGQRDRNFFRLLNYFGMESILEKIDKLQHMTDHQYHAQMMETQRRLRILDLQIKKSQLKADKQTLDEKFQALSTE